MSLPPPTPVLICVTNTQCSDSYPTWYTERNRWKLDPGILSPYFRDSSASSNDPRWVTDRSFLPWSVGFGVWAALIVGRAWRLGMGLGLRTPHMEWRLVPHLRRDTGETRRSCIPPLRFRQRNMCYFGSQNCHDIMLQKGDWLKKHLHN